MPAARPTLDGIQALRGVAAMMVVLWHASRFISPYNEGLGWALFGAGRLMGVDLFFVISGFIMVYTTRDSDGTAAYAARFLGKRIARIWPVYVVLTLLYVAASAQPLEQLLQERPLERAWLTATFVPLSMPAPAPALDFPLLPVGWTLNYEMYFYAAFAAALLAGRRWALAFFAWIAATVLAAPLAAGGWTGDRGPFGVAYLNLASHPIVALFAAGVAIGLVHASGWRIRRAGAAAAAMLAALALAGLQFATHFRLDGHGLAHSGLTAVPLVAAFAMAREGLAAMPRPLVFLGDVSFSLYLVHPLVQEGAERAFQAAGRGASARGFAFLLLTVGLSIAAAWVSHRLLERRLSGRLRVFLLGGRQPGAVPAAASGRAA